MTQFHGGHGGYVGHSGHGVHVGRGDYDGKGGQDRTGQDRIPFAFTLILLTCDNGDDVTNRYQT